jgi:hypothetical protein
MSDYTRQFVQSAKRALSRMAAGDPDCDPASFDRFMSLRGLALEDVEVTAEDVSAAKRRWPIERRKPL